MRSVHQFAMVSDRIRGECIEVSEYPELARRYNIFGVPKIVVNETLGIEGAVPPEMLLQQVEEELLGAGADADD